MSEAQGTCTTVGKKGLENNCDGPRTWRIKAGPNPG